MQRHSDNAAQVAEFLAGHPAVSRVLYPGLPDHPGHEVAARQMRGFGGMVSVRMRGGAEAARELCSRTEIFILAESLGGVESLIEHPGAMTHASTAGSQLEVPDDLVRLSVGIEDPADLLGRPRAGASASAVRTAAVGRPRRLTSAHGADRPPKCRRRFRRRGR